MRITSVTIKGFRSLVDIQVPLKPYACLVGANDAGKSSFLRAIQHLFEDQPTISTDDPSYGAEACEDYYIEAEFDSYPAGFPYAPHGVAKFRRCFKNGVGLYYWGDKPKLSTIAAMAAGDLKKGVYDKDRAITAAMREIVDPLIAAETRVSSATAKRCFAALEAANLVETEPDWTSVSADDLRRFVRVHFLPADARAEEEMSNKESAMFYRLGGELIREAADSDADLKASREAYETALARVKARDEQGRWTNAAFNEMEQFLLSEVRKFDPNLLVEPEAQGGGLSPSSFGMSLSVRNEVTSDIKRMGHGCRRSVMFAMLQTLAHVRAQNARRAVADGQDPEDAVPYSIFLIEEPELYLHPQKEKERMRLLQELSAQPNTNVVIATHSAFFIDLSYADGILRFEKVAPNRAEAHGWRLAPIDPTTKEGLNSIRFCHPSAASMVFARRVIIAEGDTEYIAMPAIASSLGLDTSDTEVVFVTGITNVPHLQRVCEGLALTYTAWVDRDPAPHDYTPTIKAACSPDFGRVVVVPGGWETLAGYTVPSRGSKAMEAYQRYMVNQDPVPYELEVRIRAAFDHQDYDQPVATPMQQTAPVGGPN